MTRTTPFAAAALCASRLRALCATVFALLLLLGAGGAADAQMPAQTPSPFAGKYSGEWVARPAPGANWPDGEPEHVGTWDITIDAEGKVTGSEYDKTSDESGNIVGSIGSDGAIKVLIKYRVPVSISGTLAKKETRLSGVLKQACSDGESVCVNIELTLKRK
ncbi:MAG TPA: hypothetical protein VEY09_01565 [Pyrinomonadaceae bacterium]|nr:hypothetical protein [Pyrinomonadaceae bacterium]